MIPGVGRYSMLITPRAGSLFHAVFHSRLLFIARGLDPAVIERSFRAFSGVPVPRQE